MADGFGSLGDSAASSLAPVASPTEALGAFTPAAAKFNQDIHEGNKGKGAAARLFEEKPRPVYDIPRPEMPDMLPASSTLAAPKGQQSPRKSKEGPKTVQQRCAERNAAAEANLQNKGVLTRALAKTQVHCANAVDTCVSAFTHHGVQGPLGAAVGTVRGSAFGVLITGIAILFTGGAATPFAPLIIGGCAAIGTIGEGIRCYNDALVKNQKGKDIADVIYAKVVPTNKPAKHLPTISDVALPHPDPNKKSWRELAIESKSRSPVGIGGR